MTSKIELCTRLARCNRISLQEVLHGNAIYSHPSASAEELSNIICNSIWKYSHSPLGETFTPKNLEEIIQIYCYKLNINIDKDLPFTNQLQLLRNEVFGEESTIHIHDIPEDIKERLERSIIPTMLGAGAAGGAAGTRWAAIKILEWTAGKWIDIIKLIPQIGPTIVTIRGAAGIISRISGPIGIALALWSINNGFGPKLDKCLGLLVGISLCFHKE